MKKPISSSNNIVDKSILKLSGLNKPKNLMRSLLLLALSALIFFILFRRIKISHVITLIESISINIWVIATILTLSFPIFSAIRWHCILRVLGFKISISRCLLIIIGIWPISSISPSKSGDFLKAFSMRHEIKPMIVMGSILTERVFDLLLLAILALIGGLFFQDFRILVLACIVITGIIMTVILINFGINLPFGQKLNTKLKDLFFSIRTIIAKPGIFIIILLLTAVNWFASIIQTKLLFWGIGVNVPLGFTAGALPIAIFVGLLPITFGGMGTRDSAMVFLFADFATSTQILAVSLLYSFFGYFLLSILGIPFMKKSLNL